jgi:hypothetical protein
MEPVTVKSINICIFSAALLLVACGTKTPSEQAKSDESKKQKVKQIQPPISTDEHDAEPPPPPPTGRPVIAFQDGKSISMTEPEAKAKGLTIVDLSNYWVPFIFSEQDGEDGERKPNDFRPIFRKLANDWEYESRTMAAAHEIVDRQKKRWLSVQIFKLRQEGLADKEIRERLNITGDAPLLGKPEDTADTDAIDDTSDDKNDLSNNKEDKNGKKDKDEKEEDTDGENDFEGGLGEADNYLELFGIPPSLSVLRKRATEDIGKPCYQEVDFDALRRFDGFVGYKSSGAAEESAREGRRLARKMRDTMEKLGVDSPEALVAHPKNKLSKGLISQAERFEAIAAAQKLLVCEGFFKKGQEKSYWSGGLDWATHQALLEFEHKCRIFGWGFFGNDTLAALAKSPEERLFDAFVRVLQERVIDAAGIIEDGSVKGDNDTPPSYKDEKGNEQPVRNLVAEFTGEAMRHMDLQTPEKVIAFLKAYDDKSFDKLFVALPMPELPPYYAPDMALNAVIDRGDVWYDYPYDAEGRHREYPRKKMPMTTLFVKWNDQDIPLVTMNTTIGGWRTELAPDGYEYYKYKNSDVGERVWKDIVAGPVWLPPDTTPMKDLIKEVRYHGRRLKVPNYDEMGPWYASAYGLVAAFHMRQVQKKNGEFVYFDNGIRSHGSVDYNSILRRFSHGCHRLYNHLAIRLFDFVLKHKPFVRAGQMEAGYSKKVLINEDGQEETYTINLDSKGYKYELKNPVPITVLAGNIRGKQRVPIEIYMPKPEEEYGDDAQFLPPGYKRPSEMDGGVPDPALPGAAAAVVPGAAAAVVPGAPPAAVPAPTATLPAATKPAPSVAPSKSPPAFTPSKKTP